MESIATYRSSRSSSFEKWVAIVLTILAVVSPLYVNQKPVSESELEEQSMDLASWLRLLFLLSILALAFSLYLHRRFSSSDHHHRIRSSRSSSSYERLVAIGLIVLGVLSPLFINKETASEVEPDEQPINFASWLPLLLLILVLAIALSFYCDRSFTSFDPNWIHRVGGSSAGILLVLLVLAFVLKCKASGL
ncbi:hypothetical protein COLO4_21142 [Corchorus olitorius]|uniref:Transmembrane protein n=1 Tax=Corchorus olitorius TaxID=93759 RepID=A0A1R3IV75_9ROSI|nr:hypothetical protein COLO4_21142 [Corchorus olitorius]